LFAACALAAAACLLEAPVAAVGATRTSSSPRTITRSAHVAYEGCPASHVLLTASIQAGAFAPEQLVTYQVTLRNLGNAPCDSSQADSFRGALGPGAMLLGPCAPLSVDIQNARGVDEYPGADAISCPAFFGPVLAPHHTLHTTGNWDQRRDLVPGRAYVPEGHYRLVIAGKVSLPVTIGRAALS
jgi:hypothetical protein